jgi:hypothetical protein
MRTSVPILNSDSRTGFDPSLTHFLDARTRQFLPWPRLQDLPLFAISLSGIACNAAKYSPRSWRKKSILDVRPLKGASDFEELYGIAKAIP